MPVSLSAYKVVMVAINLIILYIVLRKLLFLRVTQFMENRTKAIKDSIDNAEKAKAEADELKLQFESQLRTARDKGEKIVEEARIKAEKEYDRIVAAAKQDMKTYLPRQWKTWHVSATRCSRMFAARWQVLRLPRPQRSSKQHGYRSQQGAG